MDSKPNAERPTTPNSTSSNSYRSKGAGAGEGSRAGAVAGKNDDHFFARFSRHVPRVLGHQIISKLVNQYIHIQDPARPRHSLPLHLSRSLGGEDDGGGGEDDGDGDGDGEGDRRKNLYRDAGYGGNLRFRSESTTDETNRRERFQEKGRDKVRDRACSPGVDFNANSSIYRMHAALLFVDISGFTALSQRLKVDDLKNQINSYFHKIVTIINKYEGEIIKFAGDAMFIIWQTKTLNPDEEGFLEAAKVAVDKAVACGREINMDCSNYAINLGSDSKDTNRTSTTLLQNINSVSAVPSATLVGLGAAAEADAEAGTGVGAVAAAGRKKQSVTYLNVHAGVAVGVLAGLDVGAHDRYEYLLLGEPMMHVAVAEGDAGTGEVVISPQAHDLLHLFPQMKVKIRMEKTAAAAAMAGADAGLGTEAAEGKDGAGEGVDGQGHEHGQGQGQEPGTLMPCGCVLSESRYFKLVSFVDDTECIVDFGHGRAAVIATTTATHDTSSPPAPLTPNSSQSIFVNLGGDDEAERDRELDWEFSLYAHILQDLMEGFRAITPALLCRYAIKLRELARAAFEVNLLPALPASISGVEAGAGAVGAVTEAAVGAAVEAAVEAVGAAEAANEGNSNRAGLASQYMYCTTEVLLEHFVHWAQRALLDDIAKHVHEVVRTDFTPYAESREGVFDAFIRSPEGAKAFERQRDLLLGGRRRKSDSGSSAGTPTNPAHTSVAQSASDTDGTSTHSSHGSGSSRLKRTHTHHGHGHGSHTPHAHSSHGSGRSSGSGGGGGSGSEGNSFVSRIRAVTGLGLREARASKHRDVLHKDSSLVSELRSVIVLFVSVQIPSALFHSPKGEVGAMGAAGVQGQGQIQTCKIDSFHFLSRSPAEIEADKHLVNEFQACMQVLMNVLSQKGGQLRQFIVDDKGTVAIATFGLKGSVNYDNAAAAVDAADLIVQQLGNLGLVASIGVTSGSAYCGLVGSTSRHEYAVMGPSTNLAARLMGRAGPSEVLCDSAIQQRDRSHGFKSLGAIKAKGYANPVPIFSPLFGNQGILSGMSAMSPLPMSGSLSGKLITGLSWGG
ncbi:nucleotide cyclase, partial [Ochromonadaceae sp. CCMP2298]